MTDFVYEADNGVVVRLSMQGHQVSVFDPREDLTTQEELLARSQEHDKAIEDAKLLFTRVEIKENKSQTEEEGE